MKEVVNSRSAAMQFYRRKDTGVPDRLRLKHVPLVLGDIVIGQDPEEAFFSSDVF